MFDDSKLPNVQVDTQKLNPAFLTSQNVSTLSEVSEFPAKVTFTKS